MRVGRFLVVGLWAIGIVTGIVLARAPEMLPLPAPALSVPLLAAFLADLALRPAIQAGRVAPITINERAVGVVGAALAAILISALSARPA